MALFGRREIQRRIDRLASLVDRQALEAIVARLNRTDRVALQAEWEIAWLAALKQAGTMRYEPRFAGSERVPDIFFSSEKTEFIADVTAVSDQGYDEKNPVDELERCLDEQKAKYGLTKGGFRLRFNSRVEKIGKRSVPRVILPPRAEIAAFVRRHFSGFLKLVALEPENSRSIEAIVEGADTVILEYDFKIRPTCVGSGHLSYDLPYSIKDNPIYRSLKAKRDQLAELSYSGLRGIIICDADCAGLGKRYGQFEKIRKGLGFSAKAIISEFFRQHSAISFVVTASVRTAGFHMSGKGFLPLDFSIHYHPELSHSIRDTIEQVFLVAFKDIPSVLWSPENALSLLRSGSPPPLKSPFSNWRHCRISQSMNSTEISFPIRTLLSILAGELTAAELEKQFEKSGMSATQCISNALKNGQALSGLQMKKGDKNADDDVVTLSFEGRDVGRSPFRAY